MPTPYLNIHISIGPDYTLSDIVREMWASGINPEDLEECDLPDDITIEDGQSYL